MMYKALFNQRKALRFRHFSRKGYALFACLGRVVTIGVLSVATLRAAAATTTDTLSVVGATVVGDFVANSPDKEATLDDVEVTGSRAPLALGQAARMVTVLSRDEILAAPVQSINDLLKMAVGVDVRQRGPIGAQTDVSIRGGTQEQIAILLNGINICDPQTGHNTFDLPCDISDIQRIEVLEGPAGRVFGTSSLVGAINVVTTDGRCKKSEVRAEAGSYGYLSTAGRVAINSHSLSASFTRSDGFSRSVAGHLNSDYQGAKAFYQGGYDGEQVQLSWHAGLTTKGFGSNTFYSAKYDEQYEKTTKFYTALQGETSGWLHFKPAIYWNRSYDMFELIRGDESKVPFNYHRTDVFGINLNSYFDWIAGRTALGAEFRNEDIVSTNLGEPLNEPFSHYKAGLNRSNLSFHLEHNILLKRFTLSAGFIAIKNTWSEMPFTVYPGIDASYRIGENWKVYASYNESLRMPSFTELYYSVGGHKADKHLKPEELRAIEGGVRYTSRTFSAKASIFHHHARNMIDWVLDTREADPVWQSVNHTKVNTFGQEIMVQGSWLRGHGSLAYCHLHQNKSEQEYLQSQYSLEYLRHKVTVQLTEKLTEKLEVTLGYKYQDRMGSYTTTEGEVKNYHPYSVIDAKATWKENTYSLYIKANNLTNHQYVDYGNVPQPGAWMIAGIRCNL
jgi:iron complex outermembrane receptor protein